jgi:hypothetical protein
MAGGDLKDAIAAHLAEWDSAHVELAIHGCDDAAVIARSIDEFCRHTLGAGVGRALFYRSSIGAVAGLELDDGRRVVVKAHQPEWPRARLTEIARLQHHLASNGGLAPAILTDPSSLGRGLAIVETYVEQGIARDGHEGAIRGALATSLHAVVGALEPFVATSGLPSSLLSLPAGTLWPTPHSRLFDFETTRAGAADIDALAADARARLTPAGRTVLGHGDWRAEHVRFEGSTPVVAFDWDSLCKGPEPALVGSAAHGFCADWSRSDHAQAPSLDEARAFVSAYEVARGRPFDGGERRLCGGTFAYSVAYAARCVHALGRDERRRPGTFQHLVATHGRGLLDL